MVHGSYGGRKEHIRGRRHQENVRQYYGMFVDPLLNGLIPILPGAVRAGYRVVPLPKLLNMPLIAGGYQYNPNMPSAPLSEELPKHFVDKAEDEFVAPYLQRQQEQQQKSRELRRQEMHMSNRQQHGQQPPQHGQLPHGQHPHPQHQPQHHQQYQQAPPQHYQQPPPQHHQHHQQQHQYQPPQRQQQYQQQQQHQQQYQPPQHQQQYQPPQHQQQREQQDAQVRNIARPPPPMPAPSAQH
ncbi:MAG: hypothetical protein MHM6MM_000611 [Cercozoa sp. M6MM]